MRHKNFALTAGAIACAAALSLSGCAGSPNTEEDVKSLTLWDSFTQYDASSPYGKLISGCEAQTGLKVERTSAPETLQKLLRSAASKTTPNLVILDNPEIAQIADAGLLVSNAESGLDVGDVLPNVLASGEVDGKAYGAPIGSNTLALFYRNDLFEAKGLTPPKNWDELTAAAAALTSDDVKGIGFSGIASEEGTFQFLPFFWGAGAELNAFDSPAAISALKLWTAFVQSGSASTANVNANQQDIRDQFIAGKLGMMVNGTWQLNALNVARIPYTVVPVPGISGGTAPSPLGGEFVQVVASDEAHQKVSATFAECMIDPANLEKWAQGQSYVMPYADAAAAQAKADPALEPWVTAVGAAQGRTADLGTAYPATSKALYTAIQEALTGSKTPEQALADAAKSLKG